MFIGFTINPIPPKGVNVGESSRRPRFVEEYSEDATFFRPTVGDMVGDTDYWDTGGGEGCDDIINLSSELNLEDELYPMCENNFVEIDGSSTGSTEAAGYVNVGVRNDNINLTTKHPFHTGRKGNSDEGLSKLYFIVQFFIQICLLTEMG